MKYQHAEAFALMWYACPCGHRERIWNSRDGVTPFGGLLCASCGGKGLNGGLTHSDFRDDIATPGHQLRVGQQFFRDGTRADAIVIIKNRIRIFAERGQALSPEKAEAVLDDARNDRGEWERNGWPMVDRWDEAKATAAKKDPRS